MGYLLVGVVCLLIAFLVTLPYVLYIILLIVGIIALIYGLYIMFVGARTTPAPGARRYRTW